MRQRVHGVNPAYLDIRGPQRRMPDVVGRDLLSG
jgi:hypothetical protein